MKKAVGATVLVVILLTMCIGGVWVGLILCGRTSYSETYTGYVSEQTYDTPEASLQGFLETEVSGKAVKAVYVGYTKEKELTETEIKALPMQEEFLDGLLSVEEVRVEYTESKDVATVSAIRTASVENVMDDVYTRKVFILTYTGMFRFFAPALTDGDALTASYYDSTFEGEKYINCTMDASISYTVHAEGESYSFSTKAFAKATRTALYEYDVMKSSDESGTAELYMVDTARGIYCVSRKDQGSFHGEYGYDGTVHEYFMQWFEERFGQLDHTFFEKTNTGYALRGDKFAEYLAIEYGWGEVPKDLQLQYIINIADGRMADVTYKIEDAEFSETMTVRFSAFGTTVIDIPSEVSALLPA